MIAQLRLRLHQTRTGHQAWWSGPLELRGDTYEVFWCEQCGKQYWPRESWRARS